MHWRLPVALVQVQAGNKSENWMNESCQILYSLLKKLLKMYITI